MKLFSRIVNAVEKHRDVEAARLTRRIWVQNLGLVSASSAVLWACGTAKDDGKAEVGTGVSTEDPVADGNVLNSAIALEHEAISLYTQAAKLPVWAADAKYGQALLTIAGSFLEHHKQHLDVLQRAIKALKEKNAKVTDAATAKADAEYLADAQKDFKLDTVTSVLQLAAKKEATAAKAYAGAIQSLTIRAYAYQSGLHSGDEAAHYGTLRAALFALLADPTISNDKVIPGPFPTSF